MLKISLLFKTLQTLQANNPRISRINNAKFSEHCFYMSTNHKPIERFLNLYQCIFKALLFCSPKRTLLPLNCYAYTICWIKSSKFEKGLTSNKLVLKQYLSQNRLQTVTEDQKQSSGVVLYIISSNTFPKFTGKHMRWNLSLVKWQAQPRNNYSIEHRWLKPATLLKVTVVHGCISRFVNCTNGT